MAHYILNGILPQLDETNNPVAVPGVINFFGVLHFYATGTFQRVIGRSFNISMSQQSMSKAIEEVTTAIVNTYVQWIRFPRTEQEKSEIKHRFMEAKNFPGVIGAVDCTHIRILRPTIKEHNYLNRKGFHSKNIQIVCDYDLRILNINGQFAGATHDSYIWRHSLVRDELEACYQRGDRHSWLLGDSGYPLEPWLMIPIENAIPESPESRYTEAHVQTRNCVERCIGVFKGRFVCLGRSLRYSPQKVGNVVNACAILHNICVAARLELDIHVPPPLPLQLANIRIHNNNNLAINREGHVTRRNIIARYFTN